MTVLNPSLRQPWRPFLIKAALVSVLVGVMMALCLSQLALQWRLMIDPQTDRCLPDVAVYRVDLFDTEPVRGQPFAFAARGITPWLDQANPVIFDMRHHYEDGKPLIKIIDGLPGDEITVTRTGVWINGERTGVGALALHRTLNQPLTHFERTFTLGPKQYFLAGRTSNSFDSRYWGPVHVDQLLGRAYPWF